MGRHKKETKKRISGTGYTKHEAAQLKYSKQANDGTYEIDIKAIADKISSYIDTHKGTSISRPGLRAALSIYNSETYNLWLDGYVNRDHRDNEGFGANMQLSDIMRAGDTAIAQWLCEQEDSKHSSRTIRLLETMGEIAPAQSKTSLDVTIGLGKYGRWGK